MTFLSKLFSRKARQQSRYEQGYTWAKDELHKGNYDYVEACGYDPYHQDAFNEGIKQALRDWNLQ